MKRIIIKTIYAILIFVTAIFVTDRVMNRAGSDLTAEMPAATFPLLYVVRDGQRFNCMRGGILESDTDFVCDSITPVDAASRCIEMEMDTYDNHIDGIDYEVRDTSGERLIENGSIETFDKNGSKLGFSLTLKDLLEVGDEYVLRLEVKQGGRNGIFFDTRILLMDQIERCDEAVSFALDFSEKTFDKEQARSLTTYMESNEEGDNTTFARVDIHSSFSQITWGMLDVKRTKDPQVQIRRINPYVSAVALSYPLVLKNGVQEERYNVKEYYYMRFGKERIYLLDYQRMMNSVFQPKDAVYSNNKISLGITDPDSLNIVESEDGNMFAFVKEGTLYSFNTTDNKTARVFTFWDEEGKDERSVYDGSSIRILDIDESGNIRFLVSGYMNRGAHEGGIGVTCYYYNSMMNTVEEEIYIPFYTSAEYLKQDVGKLAYVNSTNKLFLIVGNKLFRVDLIEKSYEVVLEDLSYGTYHVSRDNHLFVWEEGQEEGKAERLFMMNFASGRKTTIDSPQGRYIRALGFVGEDLVYGTANTSDLVQDEFGNTIFLMSTVQISDEDGNILKTYEKAGTYITDAEVSPQQVRLIRVTQGAPGQLTSVADDYIMNDAPDTDTKNAIEVVATQNLEKVVQVAMKASLSSSKMKVLTPKQVMYEGQRQLFLSDRNEVHEDFFVYDMYGLAGIFTQEKEALTVAEDKSGRVIEAN